MRTSVQPIPPNNSDPEDTDEFPGCAGNTDDQGELIIVNHDPDAGTVGGIESTYLAGQWAAYTTTAD